MAGGPLASMVYNVTLMVTMFDWVIESSIVNHSLRAQSIISPFKILYRVSCFFVDDIASSTIGDREDVLLSLLQDRKSTHAQLDAALLDVGAIRNTKKEQSILFRPHGAGTSAMTLQALDVGCDRSARYLGPTVNDSHSFVNERSNRIRSAQKNWHQYYGSGLLAHHSNFVRLSSDQ